MRSHSTAALVIAVLAVAATAGTTLGADVGARAVLIGVVALASATAMLRAMRFRAASAPHPVAVRARGGFRPDRLAGRRVF